MLRRNPDALALAAIVLFLLAPRPHFYFPVTPIAAPIRFEQRTELRNCIRETVRQSVHTIVDSLRMR